MNMNCMCLLSKIIFREKKYCNVLFSMKMKDDDFTSLCISHCHQLYEILKIYGKEQYCISLPEPLFINLSCEEISLITLEDLLYYSKLQDVGDNTIQKLLSKLISIKISTLHKIYCLRTRVIEEFTPDKLSKYNGKNGMPLYVSVDGIVYDLSSSPSWAYGTHFNLTGGKDLSNEFINCHVNKKEILSKLPIVGKIKVGD